MSPAENLSFLSLVLNASFLVQAVMLLLIILSVFSWTIIFYKSSTLRKAQNRTQEFEKNFWSGGDLNMLYQSVAQNRDMSGPLSLIFEAGMREFVKFRSQPDYSPNHLDNILSSTKRAMRAAYQRELDGLDSRLPFLASVGSVSPYIGLFGTVWGIMNAMRGLANVQQATLANVAPGIAEALIATAIGLFAAIPAVIAYNRYINQVDRLAVRFESFIEEFLNVLQRQIIYSKSII